MGGFFIFTFMRVFGNYFLLSLYFFCYLIPQYIPNLFLTFDRVVPQMLAISILNIFSFVYVYKNNDLKEFISKFEYKTHLISYLFFIIVSTISLVVADNFAEGVVTLVKLLNFFVAFCLIVILSSNRNLNLLNYFIVASLLGLFVESLVINIQVYNEVILNGSLLARDNSYSGFGANINIASFSVLIKSIIPIYLLYNHKSNIIKALSCFLIFFSFLAIFLLMSRAAVLSLSFVFISVLFLTVLSGKLKNYIRFGFMIISLAASIVSYNIVNEKNAYNILSERFSNVTDPSADESVNERLNFYTTAIQSIGENPILGIGIGNWKIKSIDLSKEIIASYRVPYFAHNDFLQFTAEIGIIGGICFIYFIFFPFILSFKRTLGHKLFNSDFIIFMIFSIYIVDSMLNFPIARPINFIYLCFTIALFYQSKKYSLK